MTDRPDPFDDLEFETAEPVEPEQVAATLAPTPTAEAPAPAPAAEAAEAPAEAVKPAAEEKPAPVAAATAPSPIVGYVTMGLSGLAFAGTIAAIVTTLASRPHEPKVSPEHAAIGRVEALLTLQQGKLDHMAHDAAQPAQAAAATPQIDPGQLAALGAAVKANQETLDRIPALIAAQAARATRVVTVAAPRPVVVKAASAAATQSPQVAEVLRAQAAIQKQLDALTAKMAKTTAACVQQNDGVIRYPG